VTDATGGSSLSTEIPEDRVPEYEDDLPEAPPAEGVRILGAEEAQAAVEGGPDRPRPEEPPRRRRRSAPPEDVQPAARFPLPADRLPGEGPAPDVRPAPPAAAGEPSGPVPLPHWTEPPTGEVPMIADEPGDEEVWQSTNQPRFRSDVGDWNDIDFDLGDGGEGDDTTAMGALVDVPEVDEDEEFAAQVAARRAPARRSRSKPSRSRGRATRGAAPSPFPTIEDETEAPHVSASPRVTPVPDDMMTRVITGAVLAGVAILAFLIGRAGTAVLASVIVAACAFELFEGFRRAGFQPATLLALLGSLSMVGIAYNHGERAYPLVTAVVVGFTLFWYLAKVVHARPMVNAAVTIFGFSYVGLLGGFAGLLLVFPDGVGMVIGLVLCVVSYDVVGYFVGSRLGHRPLMPDISPNKTLEGLAGGMAASVVMGLAIAVVNLHPWTSLGDGFLLGLIVAVFAPLGDLVESMLKRDLGLKDFGTILPGHGGVLDRFDALLFCLPAVYYLVVALGLT
jgi:phosphatidate cytidylyltransferase